MLNVWKIDRFALHDGPGIRTSIYLKGCPLRCLWCSNPEGQEAEPHLVFRRTKCIGCGLCIRACVNNALKLRNASEAGFFELEIDKHKCDICGECVSVCSSQALEVWGSLYSIDDMLAIIERDRQIFKKSGGGITLTGGEPLYQSKDLVELLQRCRKVGIHIAIETSAYSDERHFEQILHQVDWLFIDLKHMDSNMHVKLTGHGNDLILRNTGLASSVLARRRKVLVIRMVIVPGINDGENMGSMVDFVRSLPYVETFELLPYHRYGANNYSLLGRVYPLADLESPSPEVMAQYRKMV